MKERMLEPKFPGDPEYAQYLMEMPEKWRLITWVQDKVDQVHERGSTSSYSSRRPNST